MYFRLITALQIATRIDDGIVRIGLELRFLMNINER